MRVVQPYLTFGVHHLAISNVSDLTAQRPNLTVISCNPTGIRVEIPCVTILLFLAEYGQDLTGLTAILLELRSYYITNMKEPRSKLAIPRSRIVLCVKTWKIVANIKQRDAHVSLATMVVDVTMSPRAVVK